MAVTTRTIACAVALAATASLDAANAQQSQALTWCMTTKADGVSLDLRISGCTTVIQSGKEPKNNLVIAFNNRGTAYSDKGQHDRAIEDFDQAIKLDPSDADVFNNRGTAYSDKGQHDRAIQDYDQAIKLSRERIVYYNLGNAYSAKDQLDRAIEDYDQAIKLREARQATSSTRAMPTTSTSAASPRPKRATRQAQTPTSQRRDASIPTSGGRLGRTSATALSIHRETGADTFAG